MTCLIPEVCGMDRIALWRSQVLFSHVLQEMIAVTCNYTLFICSPADVTHLNKHWKPETHFLHSHYSLCLWLEGKEKRNAVLLPKQLWHFLFFFLLCFSMMQPCRARSYSNIESAPSWFIMQESARDCNSAFELLINEHTATSSRRRQNFSNRSPKRLWWNNTDTWWLIWNSQQQQISTFAQSHAVPIQYMAFFHITTCF